MNNPGCYSLAALGITTALTSSAQSAIEDLEGMTAVSLEAAWAWGSGGTSVVAVVQVSSDEGNNWRDVARFDFATAAAVKYANLSGLTPKGITAYAALSAEGVTDGLLGKSLRCVITSVGTFVNSTLAIRATVR